MPSGVLLVVVTVRVEGGPPGAIEVGLNDAVALPGKPLTPKLTLPLNPFSDAALTV